LHGVLVDLLIALRDHYEYAFSGLQPGSAATEWQRVFVDPQPRLRDLVSRNGCTRDEHREDVTVVWPGDAARWRPACHRRRAAPGRVEQAQPLDEA
jgi:hypothetical protein